MNRTKLHTYTHTNILKIQSRNGMLLWTDFFFLIFEIPSVLSNENSPEKQNLDVEREEVGWVLRIWLLLLRVNLKFSVH